MAGYLCVAKQELSLTSIMLKEKTTGTYTMQYMDNYIAY